MTETDHNILQLLRTRGPMSLEAIAKSTRIGAWRVELCLDSLEKLKLVRIEASARSCLWCANIVDVEPVRDVAPPHPSPERVALERLVVAIDEQRASDSIATRARLSECIKVARAVLGGGK